MQDEPAAPKATAARNRYLPILSLLLVLFVAVWMVRSFWPARERKMVAAYEQALKYIPEHYVDEIDAETLHRAAMAGMLKALPDRYSGYMPPDQVRATSQQIEGQFGGIGVSVRPQDGGVMVVEVFNGPAKDGGIRARDLIVAADGQSLAGKTLDEALALIRGEVGTRIALGIRRADTGKAERLTITRALIRIPNVSWKVVGPGIGLVLIRQFDMHTVQEMKDALCHLHREGALRGLLLDLRANPGGLLPQAVETADMFLSHGLIVKLGSRLKEERAEYFATLATVLPADVPIVVLVDSQTASAAEVLAGALQAQHRATIVGTRTFGKGFVGKTHLLPDGSGFMLIVSHYTVASNRMIEGNGIEPDVKVGELPPPPAQESPEAIREWIAAYTKAVQEQADKGLEVLKERMKAAGKPPAPAP